MSSPDESPPVAYLADWRVVGFTSEGIQLRHRLDRMHLVEHPRVLIALGEAGLLPDYSRGEGDPPSHPIQDDEKRADWLHMARKRNDQERSA